MKPGSNGSSSSSPASACTLAAGYSRVLGVVAAASGPLPPSRSGVAAAPAAPGAGADTKQRAASVSTFQGSTNASRESTCCGCGLDGEAKVNWMLSFPSPLAPARSNRPQPPPLQPNHPNPTHQQVLLVLLNISAHRQRAVGGIGTGALLCHQPPQRLQQRLRLAPAVAAQPVVVGVRGEAVNLLWLGWWWWGGGGGRDPWR